jgi:putative aldouronate transport system substrate-binding protein
MTKKVVTITLIILTIIMVYLSILQKANASSDTITIGTFDGAEILSYPIIKQAEERLNIKFKIITIPEESWQTKIRLMVAGGTLPDIVAWYDVNFGEYYNFAKAGIMKELPDLSKYPNVNNAFLNKSNYYEDLKVDGKSYLWPKDYTSNPFNEYSERMYAFRLDWVHLMGSLFGDPNNDFYNLEKSLFYKSFTRISLIEWDEFFTMLSDFKELAHLISSAKAIPYIPDSFDDYLQFMVAFEQDFDSYKLTDDGYIWGPRLETSLNAVNFLNQKYKEGLIYQDIATMTPWSGNNQFVGGNALVLGSNGTLGFYTDLQKRLTANTGTKAIDSFGVLAIKSPDGSGLFDYKQNDFWGSMFINSNISDVKLEKWMQFMDFVYSPDIIRQFTYGMEGIDFEMKGAAVVLKWPIKNGDYYLPTEKIYISKQATVLRWFELEGRSYWMSNNPLIEPNSKLLYKEYMELKTNTGMTHLHSIPNKLLYSTNENYLKYGAYSNEITQAIILATVSNNATLEWNNFINQFSSRVALVESELNKGA